MPSMQIYITCPRIASFSSSGNRAGTIPDVSMLLMDSRKPAASERNHQCVVIMHTCASSCIHKVWSVILLLPLGVYSPIGGCVRVYSPIGGCVRVYSPIGGCVRVCVRPLGLCALPLGVYSPIGGCVRVYSPMGGGGGLLSHWGLCEAIGAMCSPIGGCVRPIGGCVRPLGLCALPLGAV
jgi:hypothetical protein